MSRPRIGVTASVRGSRTMWWFNRLALRRAGARAVRITADRPYPIDRLDGLVIGGGDDIDARLYGVHLQPTVKVDHQRDRMELAALDHALARDLPVLGICRGAQMINVKLGGSLHADVHEVYVEAPRLRTVLPRKEVAIEPDSRLHAILGFERCCVNALHHQSVDRPGDGVRVVARDAHGIVQGIEVPDRRFLLGVQWHPEFLALDRRQQNLFRALVRSAAERAAA